MKKWEKPVIHRNYIRENPSFSSTLLDSIYNSIDEPRVKRSEKEDCVFNYTRESMRSKKRENVIGFKQDQEKWMAEKKKLVNHDANVSATIRRSSMSEFDRRYAAGNPVLSSSSSSSSQSSCEGGFSSSESEFTQRPKPIRTSSKSSSWRSRTHENRPPHEYSVTESKSLNHERNFVKTKSRALKNLYKDLKRVKQQPLSPGGKLASFLNSLFTTGHGKKAKVSSKEGNNYYDERKTKTKTTETKESYSACSSASSFSRSCLSKTPSSRGNTNGSTTGVKRSVTFGPVSVILDENSRSCGHNPREYPKTTNFMDSSNPSHAINDQELKLLVLKEKVEEAARNYILKKYQNKNEHDDRIRAVRDTELRGQEISIHYSQSSEDEEEDDDNDAASYASSDLFELGNLSPIGIDRRYINQDLPVYETTHLDTNLAIANGFFQ